LINRWNPDQVRDDILVAGDHNLEGLNDILAGHDPQSMVACPYSSWRKFGRTAAMGVGHGRGLTLEVSLRLAGLSALLGQPVLPLGRLKAPGLGVVAVNALG
jgi:hypothetical protein